MASRQSPPKSLGCGDVKRTRISGSILATLHATPSVIALLRRAAHVRQQRTVTGVQRYSQVRTD